MDLHHYIWASGTLLCSPLLLLFVHLSAFLLQPEFPVAEPFVLVSEWLGPFVLALVVVVPLVGVLVVVLLVVVVLVVMVLLVVVVLVVVFLVVVVLVVVLLVVGQHCFGYPFIL